MINFIKKAVESVEGIKSFLFNTDYRNNFSLGNVDYPCCVLTPIMNTKYDLNNFIHESAELQISIIDTAPYEYTGDDLYAINKRCSDLLLQVIANLQVKTKFNKELTFEFILPSGDELVSGVMCNITATMKQGSCIGAPSYVEVVVQPIVRKSITTNGTYHIIPSKGFNAMREVEVDVRIEEKDEPKLQSKAILITTNNSNTNIVADEGFDGLGNVAIDVQIPTEERSVDITRNGEVEILPTSADAMTKVTANVQVPPPPLEEKQVTIIRNGTTEIVPTSEYGLSRVEVVADVALNLQDKQVAITENGTTTIVADEGFEGLSSVEVSSEVYVPKIEGRKQITISSNGETSISPNANYDAIEGVDIDVNVPIVGYDFSKIYSGEEKAEFDELYNELFAKEISYAKQIKNYVENNNKTNWTNLCLSVFANPTFIPSFNVIPTSLNRAFVNCSKVRKMPYIDASKTADFSYTWSGMGALYVFPSIDCSNGKNFTCTFQDSPKITSLSLNIKKATNMSGTFVRCSSLKEIDSIGTDKVTNFDNTFYGCTKLKKIKLSRIDKASSFGNTFYNMSSLESLEFDAWKKGSISLSASSKLTPQSIHYIIQNAMSVADGATARTLTLHATAKANWEASEYYQEDLAILTDKGITIA